MLRIDDDKIIQALFVEGANRGTTLAKLDDGRTVDLYYREYKGETYIVVGIDYGDEYVHYLVADEEIGTVVLPDTELNEALTGLKDALSDLVTLLEEDKKGGD